MIWWFFGSGAVVSFLLLGWSAVIEPRLLVEEREEATIPALAKTWNGSRVALIADLQIGMWLGNSGTVRRAVERVIEMRPAAVFIAGDFVYHALEGEAATTDRRNAAVRAAIDLVRPLPTANVPTYAVLGNHDYRLKSGSVPTRPKLAVTLRRELENIGVRVLQNDAVPMIAPGAPSEDASALWLVGLAPHLPDRDQTSAAFEQVPDGAPRIVLMHNPDSFAQLPAGSAPLALAGHTHGGQVRFPWQALRHLLGWVNQERPELCGWIHHYGEPGNRLYINRGLGFSRLPIRFNSPPEITVFTLRAE